MRQGGDEVRLEVLMGESRLHEGYGFGGQLWPCILNIMKMSFNILYHFEIIFSFNNLNYF